MNKVSIIIIVKNDPSIERLLTKIFKMRYNFELEIIVVDASDGNLNFIKHKFKKVKWINFNSKSNKNITIPEQRNLGLVNATGKIIVFIDADCIPSKNWLVILVKPIIAKQESIVGGGYLPLRKHSLGTGIQKVAMYTDEHPTMNIAIKKDVFKSIGNFDENFSYGEDVDLCWRALDAGFKIRYLKHAIVYHDYGTIKKQISRAFLNGKGRAKLYIKHKNRWRHIFYKDNHVLFYPVFILSIPFIFITPWYATLIILPLFNNRKHQPVLSTFNNIIYGLGVLDECIIYMIKVFSTYQYNNKRKQAA